MLESYQAFADYNDMMIMVEEMISSVADEIYGTKVLEFNGTKIDFTPPWPRLDLRETIKESTSFVGSLRNLIFEV